MLWVIENKSDVKTRSMYPPFTIYYLITFEKCYTLQSCLFCILCCTFLVLTNQCCCFLVTTFPTTTPITSPLLYPIRIISQSNSIWNLECWSSSMLEVGRGEGSGFSYFLDNGLPHNPKFSWNKLFSKVSNCWPCGIGQVIWLCEKLKDPRKVSCVSFQGIYLESLF